MSKQPSPPWGRPPACGGLSGRQRKLLRFFCLLLTTASLLAAVELPFAARYRDRFHGPTVRVRQVEGVEQHLRDGKLSLRLSDFLTLMLKNNTEVHLTRLDVLTAADTITAARAAFDPSFTLGFNTLRTEQPRYSQIDGAATLSSLSHQAQIGYSQVLSTGQSLRLDFLGVRSSDNSQFNYYNPSIFNTLGLALTQPLLANRNNLRARAPLEIAKSQLLITTSQTEARIADLMTTAALQYWDTVQARDNIRVQQLAVDLAQKSYERDKMALDLGALSKLDIFQSQSQVAQRRIDLVRAQFTYREMLDGLRRLIGADLLPATRNIEIVLDDDPTSMPLAAVQPLDQSLETALARRPELKVIDRRYSIDDLNAKVARNSMLPQFDLGLNLGGSGLGGNQIPISSPLGTGPSAFIPGGLGDALGQLFRFRTPYYGFSIQMTVPVKSSQAAANLADALVSRARDQYTRRQLEQQVIQDVKRSLTELEMAAAQIEAAKLARDLARSNVDAQQQRYEIGGITPFELLDAQNRLATIEGALVASYTNYQRALISYKRATWTLLDGMGVIVEAPANR
jgi:outer membrane protein